VAHSYRRIVGQNIRHFRKKARLSQEELGEKSDLSYKYVGEVERGCVNVSLDALMRVARALKISIQDILRGVD
jgi:XRE family transcriptional regulator, regulator of sulfur utilization